VWPTGRGRGQGAQAKSASCQHRSRPTGHHRRQVEDEAGCQHARQNYGHVPGPSARGCAAGRANQRPRALRPHPTLLAASTAAILNSTSRQTSRPTPRPQSASQPASQTPHRSPAAQGSPWPPRKQTLQIGTQRHRRRGRWEPVKARRHAGTIESNTARMVKFQSTAERLDWTRAGCLLCLLARLLSGFASWLVCPLSLPAQG
ncbi:hypothetical protein HDK90DRAFT_541844, partial [Phyllosticta capitalensis]